MTTQNLYQSSKNELNSDDDEYEITFEREYKIC